MTAVVWASANRIVCLTSVMFWPTGWPDDQMTGYVTPLLCKQLDALPIGTAVDSIYPSQLLHGH